MGEIIKKCQGYCPVCWSEDLEWGSTEISGAELRYAFTCNNCGSGGTERYELTYIETATKMRQYDLDEFVVRVYGPGEHYGVDDSVINDSKKSIVEFYHKKNGKEYFTASYYDKTLIDRNPHSGLILDLNRPELYIKPEELKELVEWLKPLGRTD